MVAGDGDQRGEVGGVPVGVGVFGGPGDTLAGHRERGVVVGGVAAGRPWGGQDGPVVLLAVTAEVADDRGAVDDGSDVTAASSTAVEGGPPGASANDGVG